MPTLKPFYKTFKTRMFDVLVFTHPGDEDGESPSITEMTQDHDIAVTRKTSFWLAEDMEKRFDQYTQEHAEKFIEEFMEASQ